MDTIDIYWITRLAAARDFVETIACLSAVFGLAWLGCKFVASIVMADDRSAEACTFKSAVSRFKKLAAVFGLLFALGQVALPFMPTSKDVGLMVLNKVVTERGIKVLQVDMAGNAVPATEKR